ncbi:hypothetical protein JCM8202_005909 [Rhodotorula sphaerocarpa]
MAFRSFVLSALVAFVTLSQLSLASRAPFVPIRHDHSSHPSLRPSEKELFRGRQAVAPSRIVASAMHAQQKDRDLVRQLKSFESRLTVAGAGVLSGTERLKRIAPGRDRHDDHEGLGGMLHDAVHGVLNVVAAHSHIRPLPCDEKGPVEAVPARALASDAPRPSASAKGRPRRSLISQPHETEPIPALEHALFVLIHYTEPVREVLPTLAALQREAIQAVLDDLKEEASLLAQGVLEGRAEAKTELRAIVQQCVKPLDLFTRTGRDVVLKHMLYRSLSSAAMLDKISDSAPLPDLFAAGSRSS